MAAPHEDAPLSAVHVSVTEDAPGAVENEAPTLPFQNAVFLLVCPAPGLPGAADPPNVPTQSITKSPTALETVAELLDVVPVAPLIFLKQVVRLDPVTLMATPCMKLPLAAEVRTV